MKKYLILFTLSLTLVLTAFPGRAQDSQYVFSLDDAFREVFERHPRLLAAREELKETKELYHQARAGWFPNVSAETSLYATDVETTNFGAGDGATTKDITFDVDQPIFRGGITFAETQRAKNLIRAGELILNEREQSLFLETASAYTNLLCNRALYELRVENVKILNQELTAANEKRELGDATKTDVSQAESRLALARSQLTRSYEDLQVSEAIFEEVLGFAAPKKLGSPDREMTFPSSIEEMQLKAEQNNPEIWVLKYEQKAAENNVDAVFRELMPQVSAFASYNKQYDPQPGIIADSETQTIGLRARIALYQGGATRSRVREARDAAKRTSYESLDVRRQIKREVHANWQALISARNESQYRRDQIRAAKEALIGVREEATLGQRTMLDILDADQELIDAEATLIRAWGDEIIAKYALAASLGMLTADHLKSTIHSHR